MKPFLNAVLASAYIVLVVFLMNSFGKLAPDSAHPFLGPIAFLGLFVLSAAVMGYLFFYQPVLLFIAGQKREATAFFARTLGFFALFVAVYLIALLIWLPKAPAGEGSGSGNIMPYNSGVSGSVTLGPTCPVERVPPDPQCADKPYATAISIYHAGSETPFIIGNSNADGTFRFSLPPGDYTLQAGGGTLLPRCAPVSVTVGPSGYASAAISCDTGIR